MVHVKHVVTDSAWAWAAGLFEGEGCIQFKVGADGSAYPHLTVKMTDSDAVARFAEITGGRLLGPYQPGPSGTTIRKPAFVCIVRGQLAYAALTAFWPWLCERRRAKALEAGFNPEDAFEPASLLLD